MGVLFCKLSQLVRFRILNVTQGFQNVFSARKVAGDMLTYHPAKPHVLSSFLVSTWLDREPFTTHSSGFQHQLEDATLATSAFFCGCLSTQPVSYIGRRLKSVQWHYRCWEEFITFFLILHRHWWRLIMAKDHCQTEVKWLVSTLAWQRLEAGYSRRLMHVCVQCDTGQGIRESVSFGAEVWFKMWQSPCGQTLLDLGSYAIERI